MAHCVVTGGTSFIARRVIDKLVLDGHSVTAVLRPNSKGLPLLPKSDMLEILQLDMCDYNKLSSYIAHPVDKLFHFAWDGTRMPQRDNEEIQQKNYKYTLDVFSQAIELGASVFVGAGSQAEYGAVSGVIYEDTPCKPDNPYGKYKLLCAERLSEISADIGIRFVWPRIFSIYGPGDFSETLIQSTVTKLLLNQDIPLTECSQMWDYLYVDDAADALISLSSSSDCSGIYNIASGKARELRDFVLKLKNITKSDSNLVFGAIPYGSSNIVSLLPNINRLKSDANFEPRTEFSQGILQIIDDIKSQL